MFKRITGSILVKIYMKLSLLGIYVKNHQDDRKILENVIFSYFKDKGEFKTIIFIGIAWYTKQYNVVFKEKYYWTIDLNPVTKKFGSKRHIVDSMENLPLYFKKNEVDLIICNGVLGWGLNEPECIEKSFNVCFELLRKDGVLILGWNDLPQYYAMDLNDIQSLKLFTPFKFEPLNTEKYLTNNPNRHTFNFFTKS